jgi:prepilin-type N-terminal cleavage/methylation domain-containing protein
MMKPAPANALRRLGFTMIELMVVIVLIGIMAVMIIPRMQGTFHDALLRSASRDLVDVFSIAASRAASLNELHVVRLESKTGRYLIERKAGETERDAGFLPLRGIPGCEGKIDSRITIEIRTPGEGPSAEPDRESPGLPGGKSPPPGPGIAFYPDGTADAVEILLRDEEGFHRTLRLNPTTARVKLVDAQPAGGP